MNCQEALRQLYDVIDQEASEVDAEQVNAHFEKCRDCGDFYKLEVAFHKFLAMKLKPSEQPTQLDELKSRILTSLDDIDCNDPKSEEDC